MHARRTLHVEAIALLLLLAGAPALADDGEEGEIEIHGYGEIHYNNPATGTMSKGANNEIDIHRLVIGWEYEFNSNLRVEGEVDFEHAATEIELEEAVLEYDLTPALSLRVGSLLMPVGPLNEFHEPPLYYSVERPYVQANVIPTSWQEAGAGIAGQAAGGNLAWRAYVTAGLDATGFGALKGLRDGRTHAAESKADDLAGVGRVVFAPSRGLSVGASGYRGGADQRTPGLGTVDVSMLTADARWRRGGFDLRGVAAWAGIDGADSVSAFAGETVGKSIFGWYAEAAYDLLHAAGDGDDGRALVVFGRYERFDTNNTVPDGFVAAPGADRRVLTGGIAYYPVEKVAFKADFEHWEDDTDATLSRGNLGAAFMF